MGQYNLGTLNSSGAATKVVSAGDPETLILNHSTKNTVLIGYTAATGSGNLLDATPLDPYASIVVNGSEDVYAVAAIPTQPATVYTFRNSIAWTPKAIQPNIVDSHTPFAAGVGLTAAHLNVPPGAQGLIVVGSLAPSNLTILGDQSGISYIQSATTTVSYNELWIPILSDADSTIDFQINSVSAVSLELIWAMNSFAAGPVNTGTTANVAVVSASNASNPLTVVENSKQMFANQEPLGFVISSLAAGGTAVILPATVNRQYFIHDIHCAFDSNQTSKTLHLTDSSGTKILSTRRINDTSTGSGMEPQFPHWAFHGAPLPVGLGLSILSDSINTGITSVFGYVSYSF